VLSRCQRHAGSGDAPMKAANYARVSILDQEPENQLLELRRYVEARGWTGHEDLDRGVSCKIYDGTALLAGRPISMFRSTPLK
jgi:hypothetical protein